MGLYHKDVALGLWPGLRRGARRIIRCRNVVRPNLTLEGLRFPFRVILVCGLKRLTLPS
jgi:hypothetical protein